MTIYRVIPTGEEKCIKLTFQASKNINNTLSEVTIIETYSSGYGIIEVASDADLPSTVSKTVNCDPLLGWSLYKSREVPFEFIFSNDMSLEEKIEFETFYKSGDSQGKAGAGWVHEGDNEWTIVKEELIVHGPVTFEEIVIQSSPEI